VPRNLITGYDHAGWKGMTLDEPKKQCAYGAIVTSASGYNYFRNTMQIYLKEVRPRWMENCPFDHPYLFVTKQGRPMPLNAMYYNWLQANRKIGQTGKREDGQNEHAGRHMYADLIKNKFGFPPNIVKHMMHHRSVHSQLIYTAPELVENQHQINAAVDKIRTGDVSPDNIPRDAIVDIFDPQRIFADTMTVQDLFNL
jgi:hypothetical protein